MEELSRNDLGNCGSIILYGPKRTLFPGEDCVGRVELSLMSRPFLLRGLWIKLTGINNLFDVYQDLNGGGSPLVSASVDLMQSEEDYQNGGLTDVLAGFGELESPEGEELLELKECTYTWPFTLKLPANAPYSHTDKYFETLYTLSCYLDSPAINQTEGILSHNVIVGCIASDSSTPYEVPENILNTTTMCNQSICQSSPDSIFSMVLRSSSRFLRKVIKRKTMANFNRGSNISLAVQSDRPAIFPFERMKCAIPIKATVRFDKVHEKFLEDGEFALFVRILMQTSVRVSEHVPFASSVDSLNIGPASASSSFSKTITTVLWECSRRVNITYASSIEEIFHIPLRIDPMQRESCLSNWPRPNPIEHRRSDAQKCANVFTFTTISPLANVRFFVEIEAKYLRNVLSGFPGFRKSLKIESSLSDIRAELFIHPPINGSSSGWTPTSLVPLTSSCSHRAGPSTPHANIAPVRVVGELLSRGPAALLVDRGSAAPSQEFVTPQRFAQLHQVVAQGIEIVPGPPIYTPAIAYLLSEIEADDNIAVMSPMTPLRIPTHSFIHHNATEDNAEEAKEEEYDVDSLQLESSASRINVEESNLRLHALLNSLPSVNADESVLARLKRCHESRALLSYSISADDLLILLLSCPLISDRENILFLIVHQKCLFIGDDVILLRSEGCIDQCFPLALQKGKLIPFSISVQFCITVSLIFHAQIG